jgi:N-acylglucosamine-6-phosphate 2-epimerase
MTHSELMESLRGALIVSCQADPGSPFRDPVFIVAFAKAAKIGGAKAVRIQSLEDVLAVRAAIDLPIIGLIKRDLKDFEVYITPTPEEARDLVLAGSQIVAFDATRRSRPHSVLELTRAVHGAGALAMADCATIEDAQEAIAAGVDFVGTTMSGYTPDSPKIPGPDFDFIRAAVQLGTPVIAEGRISSPAEAKKALKLGAFAVVVGSAITRPDVATRWYAEAISEAKTWLHQDFGMEKSGALES